MPRQRPELPQFLDSSPDPYFESIETVVPGSDDEESPEWRAAKRARIESHAARYRAGHPLTIMSASLKGPFDGSWKSPCAKPMDGAVNVSAVSDHMSMGSEHEGVRTRVHNPEYDCRPQTRASTGLSVSEETELAKDYLRRESDEQGRKRTGAKASNKVLFTTKSADKSRYYIKPPQSLFPAQSPQTGESPASECSLQEYLAAAHPERSRGRSPTKFQGFSFHSGTASSTPTITIPAEKKRLEGTALKPWNETQAINKEHVPSAVTPYQSLLGGGGEMSPSDLQESRSSEWPDRQVAPRSSTAENRPSPMETFQTRRSNEPHSRLGYTLTDSGHPRLIRPMNTLHQQLPAVGSHISRESRNRPVSAPGLGEWSYKNAREVSDIYDLPMSPSRHLLNGRQGRPSRSEARNSHPELQVSQKIGKVKAGVQHAAIKQGLPVSAIVKGHAEGSNNGQRSRSCDFATTLHLHPRSLKSTRDSRISASNCRLHRNTNIPTGQFVQQDSDLLVPASRVTQLAVNVCHKQHGYDSGGQASRSSDKTSFKDLADTAGTEELGAGSVRTVHRTSAGPTKSAMDGSIPAVMDNLEVILPSSALVHLDGIQARVPYQSYAELDADIKELSEFLDGWDLEAELQAEGDQVAPPSGVPVTKP